MIINVSEFRRNISYYLSLVYFRGQRIRVKRGKQILAVINSPKNDKQMISSKSLFKKFTAKIEKSKRTIKKGSRIHSLSTDIDKILYVNKHK